MSAYPKNRLSGFTLIELMMGIVILAILLGFALPSFRVWLQNSQVRNAAESVQNGLQRARAEAVSRNANVEFILGAGSSWRVKVAGVGGAGIESKSSSEGSKSVTLDVTPAGATTVTFNNFGGTAVNADGGARFTQVDLAAPGASQSLRVTIGLGGNARMCDPSVSAPNPRAC